MRTCRTNPKVIAMPSAHGTVLDNVIRCHRVELKSVGDMPVRELFSGFDTLRAITFSSSADFVDRLAGLFERCEIVLGAEFLVRRNGGAHDALYQCLTGARIAEQAPLKYPGIGARMRDGAFALKASTACLDHRKLYLLSARDGRTRVIVSSANMSGKAWNGDHIELYEYDDSPCAYAVYKNEFDVAWDMSADIPYQVAGVHEDDIVSGNVVIKKSIEAKNMLVMPVQDEAVTREVVEYVVRCDDLTDEYRDAFRNITKLKNAVKDGFYNIKASQVAKADAAYKQALRNRRMELQVREQDYPGMEFFYDHDSPAMSIGGKAADLRPDERDVHADIENLLAIFHNFDDGGDFIGNLAGLRRNHYKFLIYMLMAPHIARLRCAAALNGLEVRCLPLFVILTSRQPDTGKTFMVRAVLSLMTGLALDGDKGEGAGVVDRVRCVQNVVKCTPYLFDEVSSQSFSRSIRNEVKNADWCELKNRDRQPVIVLTSNEMSDPADVVRKRSVHLPFDAALRSDVDRNALGNRGIRLRRSFTGAFYREFSRRALPRVSDMLDYIWAGDDRASDWYPDVVDLSSEIFLEILSDFGCDAPEYMTKLKWDEDYSSNRNACRDTIREIQNLYGSSPEAFRVSGDQIVVSLGTGSAKQKLMESWCNTLPPEVCAESRTTMQDGSVLKMDLNELERLGFRRRRRMFDFPRLRGRRRG